MKISEFTGKYKFLSNFYMVPVTFDGIEYTCSEGAYMAQKTTDIVIRKQIAKMDNPGQIKKFGRTLKLRESWEAIKFHIMKDVVRAKFEQNPELKAQLLETGNAVLEEGNWWGDIYWGVSPANSGCGDNRLGIILMMLRVEMRK